MERYTLYIPLEANTIQTQENNIKNEENINGKIYIPLEANKIQAQENNIKNEENIDEKINNPPDAYKIKVKENLDKTDKIDERIEGMKMLNDPRNIEVFIDKIDVLRKGRDKIMNLFKKLKSERDEDDLPSYSEHVLFAKILCLLRDQIIKDKIKMEKEKDENNHFHQEDEENIIENNEENQENDVLEILKNVKLSDKEYKYIDSLKKNKNNLVSFKSNNNDDDNANNEELGNEINPNEEILRFPPAPKFKSNFIGDCFSAIRSFVFKKVERSDYEGLRLHISLSIIIVQYILYTLSSYSYYSNPDFEFRLPMIYGIIICTLWCDYIFYKLFYKKYGQTFTNKCTIIFNLLGLCTFKEYLYFFLILAIGGKIFMAAFIIKITYLIYFCSYLNIYDGLIHYGILSLFGFMILCIGVLISLNWLSLKEAGIELIISCVEMIFIHLGIFIGMKKQAFTQSGLWNALNLVVFDMIVILFPAFIGTIFVLICITFGAFIAFLTR